MYTEQDDSIDIIYKNGIVKDISQASDMLNIELLKKKSNKNTILHILNPAHQFRSHPFFLLSFFGAVVPLEQKPYYNQTNSTKKENHQPDHLVLNHYKG